MPNIYLFVFANQKTKNEQRNFVTYFYIYTCTKWFCPVKYAYKKPEEANEKQTNFKWSKEKRHFIKKWCLKTNNGVNK